MAHRILAAARWSVAACAAWAAAAGSGWMAGSGSLPPAAARGHEIYLRGVSPSGGEITALMGGSAVEVPATVLPCVNCHGENGRGRPEGGIVPTNITWDALTKPYGVHRSGGREHPPYDERLLARSIAMGIDSRGNELHLAMPRYRLTHEDMNDLVAYLKIIGAELAPGLSAGKIRIGTLLPRKGRFAARGAAMEAALRAYFEELNERGGIYSRKVELRVGETAEQPEMTAAAARKFLEEEDLFALTGVFMAGAESEIAGLAAEAEIPLVGALSVSPRQDSLVNRHVFYLDEGLEGQARALIEFTARQQGEGRPALAILHREGAPLAGVIEAIEKHANARGWAAVRTVPLTAAAFDPPALARSLRDEGTELILLLASGAPERALLDEAARLAWRPQVLLPGSLASAEVLGFPEVADQQLFLAFPTLPSDRTHAGLLEYQRLAKEHELPAEFPAAQVAALTSAKVLVEGLKRAGGELSREGLLAALDDLREFGTDLTPQVTYGPNRRVGIRGAHILSLDPGKRTLVPVGDWIEVN
jgi:ABC-type branched-subunit amino acid transport system substrate-binding protein